MPRGFLPVGISSTRVVSVGSLCTDGAPVLGSTFSLTMMLLAALITYASSALCFRAMAQGWVMKRLAGLVCTFTAACMLMVLPASLRVVVSTTLRRLCVLTLKRTGPFGEAPVFGMYANLPRIPMLLSW